MAYYYPEPSHTFSEYLLIPGYTSEDCVPDHVSLKTPLVKYRKGKEEPAISLNVPLTSAVMQSVSNDTLAIALAKEGGISFIFGSQSIENQAAMVARVKGYKAGFVTSASNLTPEATLADVLALKQRNGFSTVAITEDGTANGKLLGIVTSRDYRVSRMAPTDKVKNFMTPRQKLVTAPADTTLKEANDIIWEHKLNSLPIVDENDHLLYFVFRKDYSSHKDNPLELLDNKKRYLVGAGINTRDYATRIPALLEAGADVLVIDSSEGYTCWQKKTIEWVRKTYGDTGNDDAQMYLFHFFYSPIHDFDTQSTIIDNRRLQYIGSSQEEQMASPIKAACIIDFVDNARRFYCFFVQIISSWKPAASSFSCATIASSAARSSVPARQAMPQSAVSSRGTGMRRPGRPCARQSFSIAMAAAVV